MNRRRISPRLLAGLGCAAITLTGTFSPAASAADAETSTAVNHYTGSLADGATWIADVPADWNGTLILYSHGYGHLNPQNAPNDATQQALLDRGYALVGSSYSGGLWALANATNDQFASLAAIKEQIGTPGMTLGFGTSMGGLISAQEAQRSNGRLDGVLTTCGLVGGGVNLNNYQLDGEYAISQLLAPNQQIKLVNYADSGEARTAANLLSQAVTHAQSTPAGRARIALAAALLNTPAWATGDSPPAPHDYAEQEQQQAALLPSQLQFVISARPSIEAAAGGNASWNVGVDYGRLIDRSANHDQVTTLYRAAGLSLKDDINTLNSHEEIRPSRPALKNLTRTSTVAGNLGVPELDLHTISDTLAPIAYENYYGRLVGRARDKSLLRQAYVKSIGHCNFTPSELVAGVRTVQARVERGRWGASATAANLTLTATATGLGDSHFIDYRPPAFVNARTYQP